ncbi:aminotransferase [Schizosaccharomyces japonicus yFS275]|uniref:Aminotransferase n=1 Tax=Schizosaccharomyces japonicus (strain yFS275 / FY16936) TaxID=402676 RepID=B6K587_SCHJY|nr:aminotransferase [Schizosaccharomyces japonicus yFS275]EEB08691.1 aminotransferase [Schizosaccharomyces japonicus yFS275]
MEGKDSKAVVFGHALKKEFFVDDNVVCANTGSFGTVCRQAFAATEEAVKVSQKNTDLGFLYELPRRMRRLRSRVAEFVGAKESDIAFVGTATHAVSTILLTHPWKQGDRLLMLSLAYPTCSFAADYVRDRYGVEIELIDVDVDFDGEEFLKTVRERFEAFRPKMFLFDLISSMPVVLTPWEKVVELCREYNVLSVVDGAHSVGLLDLNLDKVQPDFFFTNTHKWLFAPSGTTILYVSEKNHSLIDPLPLSYGYGYRKEDAKPAAPFAERFRFSTYMDSAKYLGIEGALDFRATLGEEAIRRYTNEIANKGAKIVADALGVPFTPAPFPLSMVNVELPIKEVPALATEEFWKKHNTFVRTCEYKGKWYTRICGCIFMEESDYERVAVALKELCGVN